MSRTENKQSKRKKIRVTLDLSEAFYERLRMLEEKVEGGSKANVIRQALQIYDFIVDKRNQGWTFRATRDGEEAQVFFAGMGPR